MKPQREEALDAFSLGRARNHDREFEAAPLGKRFAAGLLDFANTISLTVAVLFLHIATVGALFPLWIVAATAVAWVVLPLWVSGKTLGLRAFGLRMIRLDGQPMDLLELAFRELIVRGTVAIAILAIAALVPTLTDTGLQQAQGTNGLWNVLVMVSCANLALSWAGQLVALFRTDRRTAADLLARVMTVDSDAHARKQLRLIDESLAPLRSEPADQWRKHESRRRWLAFGWLEVACLLFGVGVPLLARVEISAFDVEARVAEARSEKRLGQLARQFERQPDDSFLAREYERELWASGQVIEAQAVRTRHDDAVSDRNEHRERSLRQELATQPSWEALDRLVELLALEGRVSEARDVYQAYVEVEIDPYGYQAFGIWLYRHHFDSEAVAMLERAIEAGATEGIAHAYLAMALEKVGRTVDAEGAFRRALEKNESVVRELGLRFTP